MSEQQRIDSDEKDNKNWVRRLRKVLRGKGRGDVIVGTVGEGARGVAVGKNIIQIGTVVIPTLPVLALVLLLASGFAILAWRLIVLPRSGGSMTGDLNIAVAEFGALDAQGRIVESADARALAQSVYDFLDNELKSLTEGIESAGAKFDIQVCPPSQTGRIGGSTREERAQSAERLAGEISADLIIYGNLESGDGLTNFIPEFYLSDRKLRDAEELVGQYEFGSILKSSDDITTNPIARQELRERLLARTRALAQFVIGLGYYALDRFDEAAGYFKAAETIEGWDDRDGKEVLYHFLGNTTLKLDDLSVAQAYYARALELNPGYARARLGAAEVVFQKSRADCEEGNVEVAGLQEAVRGYQSALDASFQPARSDIQTKTAFALGRAYVCLSQALVADYWADAEREFLTVIADFEDGNDRVKELAAEAHAHLGLVYLPAMDDPDAEAKYRRAAEEYRKAIELSRHPDRQAVFYLWLAWIHIRLKECDEADEALAEADKAYANVIRPDPDYEDFRPVVERASSSCQLPIPIP